MKWQEGRTSFFGVRSEAGRRIDAREAAEAQHTASHSDHSEEKKTAEAVGPADSASTTRPELMQNETA